MKKRVLSPVLFVLIAACAMGCGSGLGKVIAPAPNACGGVHVSGIVLDSMTSLPIAQARAVLESGTPDIAPTSIHFVSFAETTSNTSGAFDLCVPAVSPPTALVLVALDAAGKAYPPLVIQISSSTDLGQLLMGGCRLLCIEKQQQTSSPATLTGSITTGPVSETGTIAPHLYAFAPDGSRSTWSLAIPLLDPAQSSGFATAKANCVNLNSFCSSYTFLLPSQKPIFLASSVFSQETGAPSYSVDAVLTKGLSCTPPFSYVFTQTDGTFLIADPGAALLAQDAVFQHCVESPG